MVPRTAAVEIQHCVCLSVAKNLTAEPDGVMPEVVV